MEMANEIRKSHFDPAVNVVTIHTNDPNYTDTYKPIFYKFGFGCFFPEMSAILIDGGSVVYNNPDIQLWIEAHEIGHYHLGHHIVQSASEEIEADLYVYNLLRDTQVGTIIIDKFFERHGIAFSEILFNNFMAKTVMAEA